MSKALLVNQITASKNGDIFMVGTKEGMFSVRKAVLEKRGITLPTKNEAFVFANPTMVIVEEHKKGDYLFPSPHFATVDSSRTKLQAGIVTDPSDPTANDPAYIAGVDKPTWTEDGFTVRSFTTVDNYIADLKIQKLEKELALLG